MTQYEKCRLCGWKMSIGASLQSHYRSERFSDGMFSEFYEHAHSVSERHQEEIFARRYERITGIKYVSRIEGQRADLEPSLAKKE